MFSEAVCQEPRTKTRGSLFFIICTLHSQSMELGQRARLPPWADVWRGLASQGILPTNASSWLRAVAQTNEAQTTGQRGLLSCCALWPLKGQNVLPGPAGGPLAPTLGVRVPAADEPTRGCGKATQRTAAWRGEERRPSSGGSFDLLDSLVLGVSPTLHFS